MDVSPFLAFGATPAPPMILEIAAVAGLVTLVARSWAALRKGVRLGRREREALDAERRWMEQQLHLSDRLAQIGALAAGVGHEINNPLAYVDANLKYAIDELRARDEGHLAQVLAALQDAREGTGHVAVIARDLKTFTRGDDETVGAVALLPVLESAISMSRHELKHRAEVVREFRGAPLVEGNAVRIGQVFLNLFVNAAQAITTTPGVIRCAAREEGDHVIVEIHDSGSGIAPEHQQRLFEPFFTTKPVGVGTGLGLAVCKRIVGSLGGSIEVESELGRGTCFRVRLRRASVFALHEARTA